MGFNCFVTTGCHSFVLLIWLVFVLVPSPSPEYYVCVGWLKFILSTRAVSFCFKMRLSNRSQARVQQKFKHGKHPWLFYTQKLHDFSDGKQASKHANCQACCNPCLLQSSWWTAQFVMVIHNMVMTEVAIKQCCELKVGLYCGPITISSLPWMNLVILTWNQSASVVIIFIT